MSDGEDLLLGQLRIQSLSNRPLPMPQRQYRFDPSRKWEADFCWPARLLIVEVDGGVFVNGGHNRGKAYTDDRERDAEAMCHGWKVLRVTTAQVESGQALAWIERLLP